MIRTTVAALAAALALPALAGAQDTRYPRGPELPKAPAEPERKPRTYVVCKKEKRACDFRSIQKAIAAARAGDRVEVRKGTYRGGVSIRGARKSYVKLIGDPRRPQRVVIDGSKARGARAQNGVLVSGAHEVTVRGIKVRNFKGNGIFVVNADGYTLRNNIADLTGVYGMYAFHTIGGLMRDNEAYYHNDAGFYIGETPPQRRPERTFFRGNSAWGNVLGFSGTNMRYVTMSRNKFFNNAIGIAPNGLDSEKYPPADENAIVRNEIFWNNFNFRRGAPFPLQAEGVAAIAPPGVGILLLGAHGTRVERNSVYGNYLGGVVLYESIFMADEELRKTRDNQVVDNSFGLGGRDRNGRDLFYDGNGSGNCFSGNTGVQTVVPADGHTLAACPFSRENSLHQPTSDFAAGVVAAPDQEAFWIRHPHAPRADGIRPLERWSE